MDICQIDSMHDEFNNLINLLDSNEKIDILVNSAGVHGNQKFGTITESKRFIFYVPSSLKLHEKK
jgi:short-subunit dehydrogenase